MNDSTVTLFVLLGGFLGFLAAGGALLALAWVLRRTPIRNADLTAVQTALGALQEAARTHSQQGTELARSLQEVVAATAQLQARTLAGEAAQRDLQEALQRVSHSLGELQSGLAAIQQHQGTTTVRIDQRIDQLQNALTAAQRALDELRRSEEEVQRRQLELAQFVTRLDSILTGSASRGAAGEHVLEAVLEHLPAEFKAFNLRIRNREVEFAFRLPNGKHVPVDSKWVGTRQLEALGERADEGTRRELEILLQRRIDEVTAYLDPDLTLGLAVIAVPDAVYRWTQRVHARALERGVVVISYSMAVPYFLTLLHFALRFLRDEETARLSAATHQLEKALQSIKDELDGRYARALAMLQNSRDELARQTASALGTLKQLEPLSGTTPGALVEEGSGGDQRADTE